MFKNILKRIVTFLIALLFLLPSFAFAEEQDSEPEVLSSAYLSDRYPNIETDGLRVFHNTWDKPKWDDEKDALRTKGPMVSQYTTYTKAIGLFLNKEVFPTSVEGTEASGTVWYRLDCQYDAFTFDVDIDTTNSKYCGDDDGTSKIQIFCDDELVYETVLFNYKYRLQDQKIDVTGVDKLRIVLTQKKGSNNTLNVIIGEPTLLEYAPLPAATVEPTATPEVTAAPTAVPSPTATPEAENWLSKLFGGLFGKKEEKIDEQQSQTNAAAKEENQIPVTIEAVIPENKPKKQEQPTIAETVLVDEKNVKITATELIQENDDVEIKFLVENNSDQALNFQSDCIEINGFSMMGLFMVTLGPGTKTYDRLSIYAEDLQLAGIEQIEDISISFYIETAEFNSYLEPEPVLLNTSAASNKPREFKESGELIYDDSGIRIYFQQADNYAYDGLESGLRLVFLVMNERDEIISVSAEGTCDNGFVISQGFLYQYLAPEGKGYAAFYAPWDELKEYGISEHGSIMLTFEFMDVSNYNWFEVVDPIKITF